MVVASAASLLRPAVHEGGHLVDEGAGAARAGAVHALLDARIEVDDLGVLAAQFDGDVGLRDEGLHGALGGDDLLDKLQIQPLREQKPARTGDGAGHAGISQHAGGARKQVASAGAHVGVVALVLGVDDLVGVVEHGELDRGRPHVYAQVQIARGVLRIVDGVLRNDRGLRARGRGLKRTRRRVGRIPRGLVHSYGLDHGILYFLVTHSSPPRWCLWRPLSIAARRLMMKAAMPADRRLTQREPPARCVSPARRFFPAASCRTPAR